MVPVMVVNVDIETVATHESPTDGLDCNNDTSAHGFTLTCCLANRSLMEFICNSTLFLTTTATDGMGARITLASRVTAMELI
jgi:hypothetical protein